jgi:hypothetical protein
MAEESSRAWAGWIAFAATIMVVTSLINICQGLIALLDDEHVVVTADAFVLLDTTSWGWMLLLFGGAVLCVAGFLLAGQNWARVAAVVVVGLHAVVQVVSLGAYPVWSILMIALDTVVLFALTARWSAAAEELRYRNAQVGGSSGLPGDSLHRDLPHETMPMRTFRDT